MRIIFADTSYWIALINPRDKAHALAKRLTEQLGNCRIVTSEMVLVELLNHIAEYGREKRREVGEMVKGLNRNPNVEIVQQTSEQFWAAIDYYESRLDKGWGITDCASFQVMEARGLWEALSTDHDFEQAGFTILM